MTTSTNKVSFLNVDLEVCGRSDLQWLVAEFGEDAVNLHCGRMRGHFVATFEAPHPHGDPNSIIGYFCHLVDNLSPERRQAWDELFSKVFDIGYEGGLGPQSYESDLRPDIVTAVARVGAALRITIYPTFPSREKEPAK